MNIQDLNTKTYVIDVDNTSKSVAFAAAVPHATTLILYNDSDGPTFAVSGAGAAPTAVFPTSSVAKEGKVIPAKAAVSFSVAGGTTHISSIQLVAGTGSLYISAGEGG